MIIPIFVKKYQAMITISETEYEAFMELLEELEDIIAYDNAKAQPSDTIPFEDFIKEMEKPE